MNCLEIAGALLSLMYVMMASQQNILCWGAAIASSVVYGVVFYSASLYAEAALHGFFIFSSIYGAYWWNKAKGGNEGEESASYRVHKVSFRFHLCFILLNSITGIALGYVLEKYTNQKVPYADGLITIFSIGTTFLVGRRILENWLYWMVIDSICVVVYLLRDLPATALLYTIYVMLAIHGYCTWVKDGIYEQ